MLKILFLLFIFLSTFSNTIQGSEPFWLPSWRFSRQLDNDSNSDSIVDENVLIKKEENSEDSSEEENPFWNSVRNEDSVEDSNNEESTTGVEIEDAQEVTTISESLTESPILNDPAPTTEETMHKEEVTVNDNLNTESPPQDLQPVVPNMGETIMLQRKNCNLELPVDDNHDLSLTIKFEPIHSGDSGKCVIVLNGNDNTQLAVFLSNIHLYREPNNIFSGETLQVVVANYGGVDFVMKQYPDVYNHQPLLLTDGHKVYIILYYNSTTPMLQTEYSYFNLEVFTYRKNQNNVQPTVQHDSGFSGSYYPSSGVNIQNIYFTTENYPYF